MRKEDEKISKKENIAWTTDSRKVGRPRLHWRDEVDEDVRMFGMRNWWMVA